MTSHVLPKTAMEVYQSLRDLITYVEMIDEVIYVDREIAMRAFHSLPYGTEAELIDGLIYPLHPIIEDRLPVFQDIRAKLFFDINKTGKGDVNDGGVGIDLDDNSNSVHPSITIVLAGNTAELCRNARIHGSPDIIIEFLPILRKDYFLFMKKKLYERFGIKEYFVIDPETGLTFHYFLQANGRYQLSYQHIKSWNPPSSATPSNGRPIVSNPYSSLLSGL